MRPPRARLQVHRLSAVAILTVLGLALWAGSAPAQEAQSTSRAAWQSVDVTLLDSVEVADPLMIVSAELPAGTRLPAEIAVPIPAGGQIQWAGEILGGDASKDPQAQPRIEPGTGYDLAVYTMRRARTAQVEVITKGAGSTSGTQRTARLAWTSPVAVPQVTVAIRVAAGSKAPKAPTGSSRSAAGDGTVQYVRTYKAVRAGQRLSMELLYQPPAPATGTGGTGAVPQAPGAPGAPAQGAGAASWAPWLLVVALAAAAYLWVTARKSARSRLEAEEEEEVEEAELEEAEPEPQPKPRPKPRARTARKPKPKPAPPADGTPDETFEE